MIESPSILEDAATRVIEYEITDAAEPLQGVAFDNKHIVVASGSYLLRLEPGSGRIIERLETFPSAGGLAYDGHHLWQQSQARFQQLEVRTGFVVRSVALSAFDDVTGIECADGGLLVLHRGGRLLAHVSLIDRSNWVEGRVISEQRMGSPLRGLTWAGRDLWSSTAEAWVRIEPGSASVLERVAFRDVSQVCDLAGDRQGRLWCVDGRTRLVRVFAPPGSAQRAKPSLRRAVPEWRPHPWPAPSDPDQATVSGATHAAPSGRPSSFMESDPETARSIAGPTFRRILVPIDFSTDSKRALAEALMMKETFGSEVHLLHLAEQGSNDEFLAGVGGHRMTTRELVEDARARLLRYVENVFPGRAGDVAVVAQVEGNVLAGIEAAAREVGATLVILGRRPRVSLWRSGVEKLMRDLGGAVLVLCTEPEEPEH